MILGAGGLERGREGVRAVIGGEERVVGRQAGLGSLLVNWTVPV